MKQPDYQLVWGLLLLCFACLAACEESTSVEDNGVGELTKLIASLPVPSVESPATRCRTDDPNLCSKKVKATSPPSKEWTLLSDEFKALNLTFPFDFSVETQYVCCDGYAQEDADSLCLPVCSSDCGVNSYCKSPEKCECYEGFLKKSDGKCVSEGEDFRADDPHVCSQKIEVNYVTSVLAPIIKKGNLKNIAELVSSPLLRQNQNKTRTEVHYSCCEEYEQKSKGELCELKPHEPTCDEDCPAHSTCIADGVCQCDEGYSESLDSCQPVCDGETIEHSRCVRPGEWECDAGYIKLSCKEEPGFLCEPHCSESCPINGECTAPNVCKCRSGFVLTHLADVDPTKTVEVCIPIPEEDEVLEKAKIPKEDEVPKEDTIPEDDKDLEYGKPEFRSA